MFYRSFLIGLLSLCSFALQASDLAKEKRWENQIADALLDGEAIHLQDGRSEFLAIETQSSDDSSEKFAIIMHGTGVHPDWPTVVQPLRVELTQLGWQTLSIQMPVLANEAEHKDYAAIYDWVPGRIDAAIQYARDAGAKTVMLIAHSQGSTMTAYFLARGEQSVDGFIAIGMGPGYRDGPMDNLDHLGKIKLSMLDLYGSEDLEGVIESADQRRSISSKHNQGYSQIMAQGADHFFEGEEDILLQIVGDWLQRQTADGRE